MENLHGNCATSSVWLTVWSLCRRFDLKERARANAEPEVSVFEFYRHIFVFVPLLFSLSQVLDLMRKNYFTKTSEHSNTCWKIPCLHVPSEGTGPGSIFNFIVCIFCSVNTKINTCIMNLRKHLVLQANPSQFLDLMKKMTSRTFKHMLNIRYTDTLLTTQRSRFPFEPLYLHGRPGEREIRARYDKWTASWKRNVFVILVPEDERVRNQQWGCVI